MDNFTYEWEMEKPVDAVRRDMRSNLPPRLSKWGYRLTAQDDESMSFERTYASGWAIFLAIILFPIGLLFLLLLRKTAILVFTMEGDGNASKVRANGEASKRLREGLMGSYPPDAPRPVGGKVGPA
jgi:hypothetical protein